MKIKVRFDMFLVTMCVITGCLKIERNFSCEINFTQNDAAGKCFMAGMFKHFPISLTIFKSVDI